MYLNLFLICLLLVFIIDLTDFYDTVATAFVRWLTHGKLSKPVYVKPFRCSLCLTWWVGLVYVLVCGSFSVGALAFVGLLSFLTPVFADCLHLFKDTLTAGVDALREYFKINE
jgi:hypothetical protein